MPNRHRQRREKLVKLIIRLPATVYESLAERSEQTGLSMSALVRLWVAERLEDDRDDGGQGGAP